LQDLGSTLAGYRLDRVIGRGGMGVVYEAHEVGLGRTVALKVIDPERALDEDLRQRFAREARLAASLDHPNVVPIFAVGETDGVLYLAMRYVAGEDLGAALRREGRLAPTRVAALVSQVAGALDAAHARDLVHRDVKPANVLVDPEGRAKVTDFGIAKAATASTLTATGMVLGTAAYLSPEQARGGPGQRPRPAGHPQPPPLQARLLHLLDVDPTQPR
jgi:serine/threonine protein kinase